MMETIFMCEDIKNWFKKRCGEKFEDIQVDVGKEDLFNSFIDFSLNCIHFYIFYPADFSLEFNFLTFYNGNCPKLCTLY